MSNLTKLEAAYLKAIAENDFRVDWGREAVITTPIWAWCPSDQLGLGKRASGVAASLSKKGLVDCWTIDGDGPEHLIAMTAAGWDAMVAHEEVTQ